MHRDDVFMGHSSMPVEGMKYFPISSVLAKSVRLPNLKLLDIASSRDISDTLTLMSLLEDRGKRGDKTSILSVGHESRKRERINEDGSLMHH
jgi:hypothetical protein